jgi:two-component system, sensor histidine kinase and response regulator
MKEHRIIGLSICFFVFVCMSDALFESLFMREKGFWDSLILNVSPHAIFFRSMITGGFLIFGMIVQYAFKRQKTAETALEIRTAKLEETNKLLETEIAERGHLEQELRKKEEWYRSVADFTYDWEFWVGPGGEFLWVSPSVDRITGYEADEFIQDKKLFQTIVHADDLHIVLNHMREILGQDRLTPHSLDFRIVRRDGGVRWINHVCQPVTGEGGKFLGRRSSNRDITARIQAEEALKRSEERFRDIYEKSPVMLHSIDQGGVIRNANGRWLEVMGYKREEVIGRNIVSFMTSESADWARAAVLPAFWESRSVKDVPYQYVRKDGSIIDVLLDSVVMDDPAWGRVSLSSVRNITLRKRAEEETRRTKALLDSIIQNLPTPVFLKDAETLKYLMWNRASEELYGYSAEEILGKTAYDVFPDRQARGFEAQDRETLAKGALLSVSEQKVSTKSKGMRTLHSKKLPIPGDDGKPRYLVGISEDITERKEAEAVMIKAREAAEQASRAKSEFLANMSHEIRTPINGIIGMTELALNTELTPEQHEYLDAVRISAEILLKLVNDVLDFSKIEAGKLELIDIEFSLRDTIGDTMTILAVQAHKKDLELAYNVAPEIPDVLMGDPGRIRQILLNLVGNAVKFTEQGEVVLKVESAGESQGEIHLHFTVTDTGIGIAPEKKESIFKEFEQADGSTSRKYGGTGLGLSISSKFCEMMGGKIWVKSEIAQGSAFHFTVQLNLPENRPREPMSEEISPLKGLRVLVVDDNATNRRILEQILIYWGMEPVVVDDGPSALEALQRASETGMSFAVILTDCMMPEMDGFQLVERINQDPRHSASTIVMLTSSGERGDAARCLKLGIAAYLLKPVKQSELLYTISRALKTSSTAQGIPALITRHSIRESKRRLSILLAEDNDVNQRLAGKMLERMGHTVTIADNGSEALVLSDKASFDLVLMDIQMPLMDGLEATKAIRDREKITGRHVPIVAMTAYALKGDKEKCLEAGMDGYISKPISATQLYETIEHVIRGFEKKSQEVPVLAKSSTVLDKSKILERVGGDLELLNEIVALFLENCEQLLSEIRHAFSNKDAELLERTAHALKGSISNFEAASAVQAALKLEMTGRSGDLTQAGPLIVQLENEVYRVREALTTLNKEMMQ